MRPKRSISLRQRLILVALALFVLVDVAAWFVTYRIVNAPTQVEQQAVSEAAKELHISPREQNNQLYHTRVSLNGPWLYKQTGQEIADYYVPERDTSDWRSMELPKNWYLEGLVYHGVIWFRRDFTANPEWQGKLIRLDFEGIDYFADVWLNGVKIGEHEGYFEQFTCNVSDLVKFDQPNVIAVRVESPFEEYNVDWPMQKRLIKGIFSQHKARPGGGWSPAGQEYNTGGIWDDVWLDVSSFLTIDSIKVDTKWYFPLPTYNSPEVRARLMLTNHSSLPADITINTILVPDNFQGQSFTLPDQTIQLAPGSSEVEIKGNVSKPELWWTWDRGNPNLYQVNTTITMGGEKIAEGSTRFGFRDVRVQQDWSWSLNGERIFIRGTNYISSQYLSQANQEWLQRDITLMREANLNLIRLNAHVEPNEFYTLADQAGLLVWQDFPLMWAYTDAPEFVEEAQRQMQAMIEMLYNHPAIAVWSVHNESPWASRAFFEIAIDYDPRQNKRLDELLKEKALELDQTRYVHLVSGIGDAHIYTGWSEGKWTDFANLPGQPFVSEYGAQALPRLEMMYKMFEPSQLNYQQGETRTRWEFQDFQTRATFDVANIDPGSPGEGNDQLITFIKNSQAYQANLIQFATESYRRAKYDPMQGIIQFMFVDEWPSITWSVLDYDRNPKPGYYALQTAMQPILPGINPTEQPDTLDGRYWVYQSDQLLGFVIWVINDTLNGYPTALLDWQVIDTAKRVVLQGELPVSVNPDEAASKTVLRSLQFPPGKYSLLVTLKDPQGQELGNNQLYFEIAQPVVQP